jgi:hypothetical protein
MKNPIFHTAAIGNLINHKFTDKMIKLKIPQKILEVTCNDTHFAVQEAALNVLRIMCQHEQAKKVRSPFLAIKSRESTN